MESIIIPPIPHLDLAKGRNYHLLLSHLLSDERYFHFYLSESMRGAYLILDNSAHENQVGQAIDTLMIQAKSLCANEVVIPDHLFDMKDTIHLCEESLQYLTETPRHYTWAGPDALDLHYMIVPQGKTYDEWVECFERMSDIFASYQRYFPNLLRNNFVLGISKDYHEMWEGGLDRLLDEVVCRKQEAQPFQIHLLGWIQTLWDLQKIAKKYGHRIRSVDSARPFVYGLNDIWLTANGDIPPYPHRSKTYFTDEIDGRMEIVNHNIEVFDSLIK